MPMKYPIALLSIVCAGAVAISGVPAASATPSPPASPPPFAAFRAAFEAPGPDLTAVGMAQSFSGDGRFTVFESDELLTTDAKGDQRHVYRRDTADGSLVLVSHRQRHDAPIGASYNASISNDGNWIAFETTDVGVFAADPEQPGSLQIALADMSTGEIIRVSTPRGAVPPPVVTAPAPSPTATPGPTATPTPPASSTPDPSSPSPTATPTGSPVPSAPASEPEAIDEEPLSVNKDAMVSADGSHVVFISTQPGVNNLGAATTAVPAVELFDRVSGDIRNISANTPATREGAAMIAGEPALSADGRFVAFTAAAQTPEPVPGEAPTPAPTASADDDPTAWSRVYRWEAASGSVDLVSASAPASDGSSPAVDGNSYLPSISADGQKIGFISGATNLLGADELPKTDNQMTDAYVRDLAAGVTRRVSLAMIDEAQPEQPDSHGFSPSVVRTRHWFEAWVSTTRISLAADGLSAVLTSMSPLVEIHGDCMGCQNFIDANSAMDVYQVHLTADARQRDVVPISVKRTDQDPGNRSVEALLHESTTPGGDSIADGRTPATADGSQIAFASLAGDLRGITGITVIDRTPPAPGNPYGTATAWLPLYVDGGEPDGHTEPVRAFTVNADAFNPHLHVPASLQRVLETRPRETIDYETRITALPALGSPARASVDAGFGVAAVTPGQKAVSYGLSVTAQSAGSVELALDLTQFALAAEAVLPPGWTRAVNEAVGVVTYTNPSMAAGEVATFALSMDNTNTHLNATSASIAASVNGLTDSATASVAVRPDAPVCTQPAVATTVVAGVKTPLRDVQCVSPGRVLHATAAHGSVSVGAGGTFTYTAQPGYTGDDTITVTAIDGYLRASDPVNIPLTVAAPPTATDDSYSVAAGATLDVPAERGVLANDLLPGDRSTWRLQEGFAPAHGTLTMNDATGAFQFVPELGFHGAVTFRYLAVGTGPNAAARTNAATVTLHVG